MILATGEKYKVEEDIQASGRYALGLQRTYKSFATYTSMFGTSWRSTYDYPRLRTSGCARHSDYPNQCLPTSVVLTLPDGSVYTYTASSSYDFTYTVNGSAKLGSMTYTPDSGYIVTTPLANYLYSAAGVIQIVTTAGGVGTALQFSYPTANSSLRPPSRRRPGSRSPSPTTPTAMSLLSPTLPATSGRTVTPTSIF